MSGRPINRTLRDESGGRTAPSPRSVSLLEELQVLGTAHERELIAVQTAFGFSESELQQYEKLELEAVLGDREERYSRQDVESMYPTATLDELAPAALEKLLPRVDPDWLDREGRTNYRLDDSFLNRPLHIVCGTRVGVGALGDRPQRFARMLLVCRDHVNKRDELDFFEAALAVPEIVMLADSLSQIDELGPVATTQLERLPELDDAKAASTMHELLVGSACVRRGKSLKMLSDAGSNKVPDFKVIDLGCRRRVPHRSQAVGPQPYCHSTDVQCSSDRRGRFMVRQHQHHLRSARDLLRRRPSPRHLFQLGLLARRRIDTVPLNEHALPYQSGRAKYSTLCTAISYSECERNLVGN